MRELRGQLKKLQGKSMRELRVRADPISHCSFRRTDTGIEGSINGEAFFNLALGEQSHDAIMSRQIKVASGSGSTGKTNSGTEAIN